MLEVWCEAMRVNVIAPGGVEFFDPASHCTATFFLTGVVTSDMLARREFVMEMGCWDPDVCVIRFVRLFSSSAPCNLKLTCIHSATRKDGQMVCGVPFSEWKAMGTDGRSQRRLAGSIACLVSGL